MTTIGKIWACTDNIRFGEILAQTSENVRKDLLEIEWYLQRVKTDDETYRDQLDKLVLDIQRARLVIENTRKIGYKTRDLAIEEIETEFKSKQEVKE